MRGTGSHDFRVGSSLVPLRRTFDVFGDWPFERGPLYRYPFASIAEMSFGAVGLGIGRHAIDEFLALAESRRSMYTGEPLGDRKGARVRLGEAEALVSSRPRLVLSGGPVELGHGRGRRSPGRRGGRGSGARLHPRRQ